VKQPSSPPFSLNNAVDALLKKECDIYREKGQTHPFIESMGIPAIPFEEPTIEWDAEVAEKLISLRNMRLPISRGVPVRHFSKPVDDKLKIREMVFEGYKNHFIHLLNLTRIQKGYSQLFLSKILW